MNTDSKTSMEMTMTEEKQAMQLIIEECDKVLSTLPKDELFLLNIKIRKYLTKLKPKKCTSKPL
jgi:hypothetical protein